MIQVSNAKLKAWSRMGQRAAVFGVALPHLAEEYDDLKLLTADLALLSGMERFQKKYPEKFLNVGIAEQNMIGIAAGLAMGGSRVFATTYASFIAVRSLEHVRQHLSHMGCNVKLIGSASGVTAAKSGVSHWATEDLAFIRALPNIEVYSPADSLSAIRFAEYAAQTQKPVYIRLSGGPDCPIIYNGEIEPCPGKLSELKTGTDIAIIATGLMVKESLDAAAVLEEKGISCAVFDMHTIKPLDKEGLTEIFKKYKLLVTVEEHQVTGGLGGAVAEFKSTFEKTPRQIFIGFQDCFTEAGNQRYVWEQAGLTADRIARKIEAEL